MSYLTYDEYQEYGGTLSGTAFSSYLYDVESKLNYVTNNRIKSLEVIPEAVKRLEFKLIGIYSSISNNDPIGTSQLRQLASYSNGIESFSYVAGDSNSGLGSTSVDNQINAIIKEYLSEYPELIYRGRYQ